MVGNMSNYDINYNSEYFHFQKNTEYNKDRELFKVLMCENFNIYGTNCIYYPITFDTDYDKLFGEDNNRSIIRKFEIKTYFSLPKEEENYSVFGIEGLDVFDMYISKKHFDVASKLHVDANLFPSVSASLKDIYPSDRPNVGDIIYTKYNNKYYEILDVGEEDEMFLQYKHSWTLRVKEAKNEHLSLSATTSASMSDINDDLITREDITRLNDYISSADDNVLYTSSVGEEVDTTNPLNGW